MPSPWLSALKQRAHALKAETYALYLAARDPRTPWYAKLLVAGIVAYALSPIDLIPDFIPVLGYLDDLILIPLGIALAIRLIPDPVLLQCRARAAQAAARKTHELGGRRDNPNYLVCVGGVVRRVGVRILHAADLTSHLIKIAFGNISHVAPN